MPLSCVAPALSAQLGAARLQREEVIGRGRLHDLEDEAYCQGGDHLFELSHGERLPDAVALASRERREEEALGCAELGLAVEPAWCHDTSALHTRGCGVRVLWRTYISAHRAGQDPPTASGTCSKQEASTRIPYVRHGCGTAYT